MILNIILLIVGTLLGGLVFYLVPKLKTQLGYPLVFAGSYLLAITIIHIIPELFVMSDSPTEIGIYVLAGFFLQVLLEHFSAGVEHGHFHSERSVSMTGRLSIVLALFIHSFLEGTLLTHDSPFHEEHESHSLLVGILLHKMPAAFALMVTMAHLGKRAYIFLLLFSLASPLGLLFADFSVLTAKNYNYLFAIVCGSFLHIATTIFVESSPIHKFGLQRILIASAGALMAIMVEYLG